MTKQILQPKLTKDQTARLLLCLRPMSDTMGACARSSQSLGFVPVGAIDALIEQAHNTIEALKVLQADVDNTATYTEAKQLED